MFRGKLTTGSKTETYAGNNKNPKSIQTRGAITTFVNTKQVNRNSQAHGNYLARQAKAFTGEASKAKNASKGDRIRQLIHTYLSLAYEMGPGLERKIFSKYILLIMYSIDKIAGSSTNFERYSQLYEEAERLTGTVDIEVQDKSSKIVLDILIFYFLLCSMPTHRRRR